MVVRQYEKEVDAPTLAAWARMRELTDLKIDSLPEVGFIVPGLAAGFIRKVEGGYGLVDGYVTHPLMPPGQRDAALDLVTKALITYAEDNGITHLIAITREQNIVTRAQKHGYVLGDWKVLTRQTSKA